MADRWAENPKLVRIVGPWDPEKAPASSLSTELAISVSARRVGVWELHHSRRHRLAVRAHFELRDHSGVTASRRTRRCLADGEGNRSVAKISTYINIEDIAGAWVLLRLGLGVGAHTF